jgi:hypothetical protein
VYFPAARSATGDLRRRGLDSLIKAQRCDTDFKVRDRLLTALGTFMFSPAKFPARSFSHKQDLLLEFVASMTSIDVVYRSS